MNPSEGLSLEDGQSRMVYWSGEQVRWINMIANHLNELKAKLRKGEKREFAYVIQIYNSLTVPVDANCEIEFDSEDKPDTEYARFMLNITMGSKRWEEFRTAATAFLRDVIRQVAISSERVDDKVGGFQLTQYKDHINVKDGGGIVMKKK